MLNRLFRSLKKSTHDDYLEIENIAFIVGCGRSGTTILGKTLANHSQIKYLNERRDLWTNAYPELDIWSNQAKTNKGKLYFGSADAEESKSKELHKLFSNELILSNKELLLDKIPINSFRLEFIDKIFPSARYIHIFRNGRDVAKSIMLKANEKKWYGADEYKWYLLKSYASKNKYANLAQMCQNNYERGLLEWRLSLESSQKFLSRIPDSKYIEIAYEDLLENPDFVIDKIIQFLELNRETQILINAKNTIKKPTSYDRSVISERDFLFAGSVLTQLGYFY